MRTRNSQLTKRILAIGIMVCVSVCHAQEAPSRASLEIATASTADTAQPNLPSEIVANLASVAPTLTVDGEGSFKTSANNLGAVDRDLVKEKLTQLIKGTKTATWNTKARETLGNIVEESTVRTAWAGVDLQRIKVLTGRGAGKTLFIRGERVHSGWLKFHHTNQMVTTVRGNSLKLNGFFDDIEHILNDWDKVGIDEDAGLWTLSFHAPTGLDSKLFIDSTTMRIIKLEGYENGECVGCYEYDSIVLNPKLSARTWKK